MRGPDVVLRERLEHRRARDARDQRHVGERQRHAGQDDVGEPRPEALCERRVALHREPVELDREHPDQHVADHEPGHRESEHREAHHAAVDPRADAPRRDHAQRHRQHDGDDERHHGQRERRLQPLADQLRNRVRGEDRVAEIAAQQLPDPGEELDQQRLVEPQLGADLRDVLGRREIAGDDRGRIAGREMQQREDEHGDDEDHRHGRQQAADQEDVHVVAM